MMDKPLRQVKEQTLIPLAGTLVNHVHPLTITGIGFAFGLLGGISVYVGWMLPALIFWIINRLFDGLDGTLARITNKQTDLGGYVDLLAYHVIYAFIPIMLALRADSAQTYALTLFMLGIFYVNAASWMALSAIIEKNQHDRRESRQFTTLNMPGGLIEGVETVIFYTSFLMFSAWIDVLFLIMTVLVAITIGQRLYWAFRYLDKD
mgnify:CR=1 FL=1